MGSASAMNKLLASTIVSVLLLAASQARAEMIQVPEGGRAVLLGKDRILCSAVPEGWVATADRRALRPPAVATSSNRVAEVRCATDCARPHSTVTLVATGPWPDIDPSSVNLFLDEGRLDFKGKSLEQAQILWRTSDSSGRDVCVAPTPVAKLQQCSVSLDSRLPAYTQLRWLPAYAQEGPEVVTLDAKGHPADPSTFVLRPARLAIAQLFTVTDALDVSQGFGVIPLVHPEAVGSIDCGASRCEQTAARIVMHNIPAVATQVTVTVRLAAGFALSRAEKLETSVTATLPVVRCPISIVSGRPLRNMDETQILVRIAERCRSSSRLRWFIGTDQADVVREARDDGGDYAVLRTGPILGLNATITASRADSTSGVVGFVVTPTQSPQRPQSTLELPGYGPINFIPTNREAVWSLGGVPHMRVVPLGVPEVYTIRSEKGRTLILGDKNSGGYMNLRYAYRGNDLPKAFAETNLAVVTEAVQRPLHEASIPIALAGSTARPKPIAEFLCADKTGATVALVPGKPARIPFSARATCRVVLHQDRLMPEDGQQDVVLEVEVTKASGGKRSDASISEHMVLRPGGDTRIFYLKGMVEQFDQIAVRLSHVVDETRYVLGQSAKQSPPSAQWSATVEGGLVRLYVSLSIPAGLYRINDPAASLTLNFGVLGRLTWLDRNGKEGLFGLETGVLGASLIPQQYNGSPAYPPTLVTLLGLGVRVEVGQGAAVGVHLWGAYEFRSEYTFNDQTASHWSILFGPSISIGNVGTNL
jgi:hypothetical protein